MIKITENATVTAVSRLSRLVQAVRGTGPYATVAQSDSYALFTIPANPYELTGIQARTTN